MRGGRRARDLLPRGDLDPHAPGVHPRGRALHPPAPARPRRGGTDGGRGGARRRRGGGVGRACTCERACRCRDARIGQGLPATREPQPETVARQSAGAAAVVEEPSVEAPPVVAPVPIEVPPTAPPAMATEPAPDATSEEPSPVLIAPVEAAAVASNEEVPAPATVAPEPEVAAPQKRPLPLPRRSSRAVRPGGSASGGDGARRLRPSPLRHPDELTQRLGRRWPGRDLAEQHLAFGEELGVRELTSTEVATTQPGEYQSTVSKASPLNVSPLSSESVILESGRFAFVTTMPRMRSSTSSCCASPTVNAAARSDRMSRAVGTTIRSAAPIGPSSEGSCGCVSSRMMSQSSRTSVSISSSCSLDGDSSLRLRCDATVLIPSG